TEPAPAHRHPHFPYTTLFRSDLLDIMSTRTEVNSLDGLPLVGVRHSRLTGLNSVIKRAIDIAVSAVALVILAVPMLVVALLIKRSEEHTSELQSRGQLVCRLL